MVERRVGIIVSGGTGRMGRGHHLPALMAIRSEGGLPLANGDRLIPDIILVGRDAARLAELARTFGIERYTTNLDQALSDSDFKIFFDSAVTRTRPALLTKALRAGKHIYAEKPAVLSVEQGLQLLKEAQALGLKHGAVEDKVYLPGIDALRGLHGSGFFGRIVKFHLEFGYWVFDGKEIACQRPSWNYKHDLGGGIVFDMFSHWRYVIEDVMGPIARLTSSTWTGTPERVGEHGESYRVDVEDSALCLLTMASGVHGSVSSSWVTRARHRDRFMLHIDGTDGSAEAGFHRCFFKHAPSSAADTAWSEVPASAEKNGCRIGWEDFLRHVAEDAPLKSDLRAGIRDVQFAELNLQSARENRWVEFPP